MHNLLFLLINVVISNKRVIVKVSVLLYSLVKLGQELLNNAKETAYIFLRKNSLMN